MQTPQDVFELRKAQFSGDTTRTSGMTARYQFDISGEHGGRWTLDIVDGQTTVVEGADGRPDVTILMNDQDFVDLNTGKLNGGVAFMTGKLKVKGDVSLAMKLNHLFKP
jgi:putative sterol carrier protein